MLFERRLREGIENGTITVMFRQWRRPQAVAGRRYRTGGSMIEVDSVEVVGPGAITDADARQAGYGSATEAVADLRGDPVLPVHLVRFHRLDLPDPRDTLAADAALTGADVAELDRRLDRMDRASAAGPWTAATLAAIAAQPGTRAADLAAVLGRDTTPFKVDVRKLKNLGLTRSLPVGYRLSPRGAAYQRMSHRDRQAPA